MLPVLGNKELDIIKRTDIFALQQKWIHDGKVPSTINKYLVLLCYIFNLALMQVDNKRQRFLTGDEAQSLINAVRNSENIVLEPIVSMIGSASYGKSQ